MVDGSSDHQKAKGVNRNIVEKITGNEYKNVLLNNKCLRHSMNRIKSNDHRIRTYEISKSSLSCFDDNIYTQNNGYNRLALCY